MNAFQKALLGVVVSNCCSRRYMAEPSSSAQDTAPAVRYMSSREIKDYGQLKTLAFTVVKTGKLSSEPQRETVFG